MLIGEANLNEASINDRKVVKTHAWIHRLVTLLLAVCCVALVWRDWQTQVRLSEIHAHFVQGEELQQSRHQHLHQQRPRAQHAARFKRSLKQALPDKPSKDSSVQLSPMTTSVTMQQLEPYCLDLARQCAAHKLFIGAPGKTGPPGPIGMTGADGPPGKPGEKGAPGPLGPIGPTGLEGPAGPPGPQGEKGEKGLLGLRGRTGATGQTGNPGQRGEKGDRGDTGASGIAQTLCANKAEKMCEKGEPGPPGLRGLVGMRGAQGPPGVCMLTCKNGETGPKGAKGEPGSNGVCLKNVNCFEDTKPRYIATSVDSTQEENAAQNANYRSASVTATADKNSYQEARYQKEQAYREAPHPKKSSVGITHRMVNHINQQASEIGRVLVDQEKRGFWAIEMASNWTQAAAAANQEDVVWISVGIKGWEIFQYASAAALTSKLISAHYKLPHEFYGSNHVMQRGHIIYQQYNHNCLLRFDFATRQSQRLQMPSQAAYRTGTHRFLYRSQHAFFDLEVATDDKIWVIYADKHVRGVTYAALVDTGDTRFHITRHVTLDVDSSKYEQSFVVSDVLYFVQQSAHEPSWMIVDLVYELRQSTRHQWAPRLRFQIPYMHQNDAIAQPQKQISSNLSMLSYKARENRLLAWYEGHLLAYPITVVHF